MIKSISLSYSSQFIALLTQIISIRLLLDYFGQDGFSSIAYLLGVIATIGIVEIGISQTLMRSNAAKKNNTIYINNLAYLYFILLTFFVIFIFFVNLLFFSETKDNNFAYFFLSIFIVKVFSIFYKSLSFGSGKYDEINFFNLLLSLIKNIVLPFSCIFFELSLVSYMLAYLLASILELLYFMFLSEYKLKKQNSLFVNFSLIKNDLKLFMQVAVIGFTWTYTQNIERLIVMYSNVNQDLIIMTLALTIMGAMYYVNTAITNLFNVKLMASLSKNEEEFKKNFLSLSKFRVFIFSCMTLTLYAFTDEILILWLNDYSDIQTLSRVLKVLIIGVYFVLISSISFQYQFIKGEIDLQLKTSLIYAVLQTFSGSYFYTFNGLLGMSISFLILNGLFSLLLISLIFYKKESKILIYLLKSIAFCFFVFYILTLSGGLILASAVFMLSILILFLVLNPIQEIKSVS